MTSSNRCKNQKKLLFRQTSSKENKFHKLLCSEIAWF